MGFLSVFFIRLILSVLLAFVISRFFFQGMAVIKIFGLAGIMFGLAYLFQYTKKRDMGGDGGN